MWLACVSYFALADPQLSLGPLIKADAGPYGYTARKLFFRGKHIDYLYDGTGINPFSSSYVVFLSCGIKENADWKKDEFDGECMQWKLLRLRDGRLSRLVLPRYDAFFGHPAFRWPYIGYVSVGRGAKGQVDCMAFDWRKQTIIGRRFMFSSSELPGTDFPGEFPPPRFSGSGDQLTCTHDGKFYDVPLVR